MYFEQQTELKEDEIFLTIAGDPLAEFREQADSHLQKAEWRNQFAKLLLILDANENIEQRNNDAAPGTSELGLSFKDLSKSANNAFTKSKRPAPPVQVKAHIKLPIPQSFYGTQNNFSEGAIHPCLETEIDTLQNILGRAKFAHDSNFDIPSNVQKLVLCKSPVEESKLMNEIASVTVSGNEK